MENEIEDVIKKICTVLDIQNDDVITFEDYIQFKFGKSYKDVMDDPNVILLKETWNTSCESLIRVLDGINMLAKKLNDEKEKN